MAVSLHYQVLGAISISTDERTKGIKTHQCSMCLYLVCETTMNVKGRRSNSSGHSPLYFRQQQVVRIYSQSYIHHLTYFVNLPNAVDISIPAAVTVFPGEVYRAQRSWAERSYHKLIYWNEVDKGGHFAAWEQPGIFTDEIRAAFRLSFVGIIR